MSAPFPGEWARWEVDAVTAVVRGDAFNIPLRDESVDLVITSPPYWALRSYRDDGDHFDGQLGSEPTPQDFLEALWAVTKELWRVLKPDGVMFVNLGDKRSGSGGHNNSGISSKSTLRGNGHVGGGPKIKATLRNAPDRYNQAAFGRPKSKMALPHRYFIGCMDGLADPDGIGWIARQDIVWSKPNGLPESVTDRVRDSHEYWFMLTKQERYFAAVDEIREKYAASSLEKYATGGLASALGDGSHPSAFRTSIMGDEDEWRGNPLGKLPGSVWTIASEPLAVPDYMVEDDDMGWRLWDAPAVWQYARHRFEAGDMRPIMVRAIDHFAAFSQEWPRRLILGWSPSGICTACGQGRRPVVAKELVDVWHDKAPQNTRYEGQQSAHLNNRKADGAPMMSKFGSTEATITGYACACTPYTDHPGTGGGNPRGDGWSSTGGQQNNPGGGLANNPRVGPTREYHFDRWKPAPTRPAVILDPFGGTGTVSMVARALGRTGVSLDLSADYCRLAAWRIFESGHAAKARERTNRENQGTLL